MNSEDLKKAKELSASLAKISSTPKQNPKKERKDLSFIQKASYLPKRAPQKDKDAEMVRRYADPKKEYISDTPEQIANKLNTAKESLNWNVLRNPLSVTDVIDAIRSLKGNDRIDISNIRNGENLARMANQGFNMNDQRWHGGGSLAGVTSISNSDGTLTISPTVGASIASLNLAHANNWTATQTFSNVTYSALFTGGNVGFGTATPSTAMELNNGTSDQAFLITRPNSSSYGNIGYRTGGTYEWQVGQRAGNEDYHIFNAQNGSEVTVNYRGGLDVFNSVSAGFEDNSIDILNLSGGFSAVSTWFPADGSIGNGRALAIGAGPTGASVYGNRGFIGMSAAGGIGSPPDFLISQEETGANGYLAHIRQIFTGSNGDIDFYSYDTAVTTGAYSLHIQGSNGRVGFGMVTPDAQVNVQSATPGAYGAGVPDLAIGPGNQGFNDTFLQIYRSSLTGGYVGIDAGLSNVGPANIVFNYSNGGKVGVGVNSPTAILHLKAGTSTANTAPLKLTSGVNLSVTEAGSIEYDGSHLYFTATNAGTRYQLDQQSTGTVTSVSGTTNRITSTGGTTPVIDISATFEALLGKVANPLSQFASTTSAQLASTISDETGTGALVFGSKPTFVGTIQTIVAIAALALDGSLGNLFTKTIGTESTFTQSNFSTGQNFMVTVTGAFTITWFSGITWFTSGATVPTQASITTYGFTCTGSNTFNGYLVGTQ